jgi:2-oxoglutarate dehydrogenase complex dehydrogenase (E1) component-like enzyme
MTHRIVVNVQTGETTQVEYTAEEQAAYDAAKIVNDEAARLAELARLAEEARLAEQQTTNE